MLLSYMMVTYIYFVLCLARQCPDLYELLNGQKTVVGPVDIGRSVEFICDSGYRLLGYDELTCMDDLRFNYPYPSCVGELVMITLVQINTACF